VCLQLGHLVLAVGMLTPQRLDEGLSVGLGGGGGGSVIMAPVCLVNSSLSSTPVNAYGMLTERGDFVIDPFAGSCVTGEVCERLGRRWLCSDLEEEYLRGALGRFDHDRDVLPDEIVGRVRRTEDNYYKLPRPGLLWHGGEELPLPTDGGRRREQPADRVQDEGGSPTARLGQARLF
jgi:hypothetical protein